MRPWRGEWAMIRIKSRRSNIFRTLQPNERGALWNALGQQCLQCRGEIDAAIVAHKLLILNSAVQCRSNRKSTIQTIPHHP